MLLRPPYVMPIGHFSAAYATPSLGLAYIAGALKNDLSLKVESLDAVGEKLESYSSFGCDELGLMVNGLSIPEIISRISPETDLIAVSLMFSNEWIHHRLLIAALIKNFPQAKIVLGGEHANADYEFILKEFPQIFACVRGEGEETIQALIKAIRENTPRGEILGIAYCDVDKEIVVTPKRKRIHSLASIAWPDWSGVPLERYLDHGLGYNSPMGKRAMPMLASRGCPYQCTFCSSAGMWGTNWFPRDIDDLVAEIKYYVERYQIDHIDFHDLTAVINKKWTIEFCDRLKKENLGLTWALPAGTRSEALDLEVLTALFESGCRRMIYAPESGSQETLKRIKKRVNLPKMYASIKAALGIGHLVKVHIIMGLPEQTKKEVLQNFLFMAKLAVIGVHDVSCFGYSPYPGTENYTQLVQNKKLNRNEEEYEKVISTNVYNCVKEMRSWSNHIPHSWMIFITIGGSAYFYLLQFMFRPYRIFGALANIFQNRAQTTLELTLYSFFLEFKKWCKLQIGVKHERHS